MGKAPFFAEALPRATDGLSLAMSSNGDWEETPATDELSPLSSGTLSFVTDIAAASTEDQKAIIYDTSTSSGA